MRKIKDTTVGLLLDALIDTDGKIPWHLVTFYLYHTGQPAYTIDSPGKYTKVFYRSDDNIVGEIYDYRDRVLDQVVTLDYYVGRSEYYTNLQAALRSK